MNALKGHTDAVPMVIATTYLVVINACVNGVSVETESYVKVCMQFKKLLQKIKQQQRVYVILITLYFADINECFTNMDKCSENAYCRNIIGSYQCYCKPGFTGNGIVCTG